MADPTTNSSTPIDGRDLKSRPSVSDLSSIEDKEVSPVEKSLVELVVKDPEDEDVGRTINTIEEKQAPACEGDEVSDIDAEVSASDRDRSTLFDEPGPIQDPESESEILVDAVNASDEQSPVMDGKGKMPEKIRGQNRADHKMLPSEILET